MRIEEIEDEIEYLRQSINHAEGWRNWRTSQLWVSLPKDESEEPIEKVHQEVDQEVEELEKQIEELESKIEGGEA
jgi:prefoldin subunit 5